jgi:2-dehydropantoate 2-reductase
MQHAILGPGGIGGLIGACLAQSGSIVTMVGRPETMAQYPSEVELESPFGNVRAAVDHSSEVPPVDVLWITVKATQLDAALRALPDGGRVQAIIPLLNGVDHVAALRSRYGHDRVIPATIAVESERIAPGHFVHRSPFANLNVASSGKAVIGDTVDTLSGLGFTCRFVDDEATLLWSKLVFLAPLALASTASRQTIGEMMGDPNWREKVFGCVREACAVAMKEGAKVDAEGVIKTISGLPSHMRSSMQKDVEQGRTPELDAIAGPIVRGAVRHHLAVPVTAELAARVEGRVQELRSQKRPA